MDKPEELYSKKIDQVIWKTIVSDTVTPISILMRLEDHSNCFLLESVEGGTKRGRYSIVGMKPDLWWKSDGNRAFIKSKWTSGFKIEKQGTFKSLKNLIDSSHIDLPPHLPRMSAGIFGYIGYDNVRLIEDINELLSLIHI